jgi:NAD(P)-dependent dehydrogenase (short-subunit alcohol dehydrogenase family)
VTEGRLAGKTAVVTGSTKGIGLGIARAYAREGARVVINSRSAEDCARVARELGSPAVAVAADLSRSDEVRRLARDALSALGDRADILVNNVGQPRVAPSESLAEDDYRHTLDLNSNCGPPRIWILLDGLLPQACLAAGPS